MPVPSRTPEHSLIIPSPGQHTQVHATGGLTFEGTGQADSYPSIFADHIVEPPFGGSTFWNPDAVSERDGSEDTHYHSSMAMQVTGLNSPPDHNSHFRAVASIYDESPSGWMSRRAMDLQVTRYAATEWEDEYQVATLSVGNLDFRMDSPLVDYDITSAHVVVSGGRITFGWNGVDRETVDIPPHRDDDTSWGPVRQFRYMIPWGVSAGLNFYPHHTGYARVTGARWWMTSSPRTAGMWTTAQRQTGPGNTGGWSLSQRQNGGHTGSWPLAQRQNGI